MQQNRPQTQCPLCRSDNDCAVASKQAPGQCWCQTITIDPATVAALPATERGQRCLCLNCATGQGVKRAR